MGAVLVSIQLSPLLVCHCRVRGQLCLGPEKSSQWKEQRISPPNLGVSQANKSKLVTCYNWLFQAANLLLW